MKSTRAGEPVSFVGAAATACVAIIAAAPAPVQAADEKDEIIVTATKRAESIYDVPISVSAIDLETIERKGVRDLEELSRSIPGLVVSFGSESGPKSFTIRGISANFDTAETAAVYVDDTPITVGEASVDLKLFDIDRVEVLRGPQGTLFGSSAMGGAIRYVMTQPGYDEFSGRARFEGGKIHDGNGTYEGQVAFGGPLGSDRLAFRASGFYRRDGGYIDRVDEETGALIDKNANTFESFGGRFALGFRPTSEIEAVASILYQEQHYDDYPVSYTAAGVGIPIGMDPPPLGGGEPVLPLGPLQRVSRSGVDDRTDRIYLPNLTINWDIGGAQFTSSTSYMNYKLDAANDFSYFLQPLAMLIFGFDEATSNNLVATNTQDHLFDAFIQEVRFASTSDGPFEWLIGGYYRDAKKTDLQTNLEISGLFGFPGDLLYEREAADTIRELAAFGELSYRLFDVLRLTAGLRYTDISLHVTGGEIGPFAGAPSIDEVSNENALTPRFSAALDVTENWMAYATAAKGFREGGPNGGANFACADDLAALGLTEIPASYDSDSLWSYELGVKGQMDRVSFQGSVYHIDWSDIQQSLSLGSCGVSFTGNLGEAKVEGVELEAVFRVTDAFTIEANGGYTNAELKDELITGTNGLGMPSVAAPAGTTLPGVPKTTANVAATYDFVLSNSMTGYLRGELSHIGRSTRHFGEDNPLTLNQDAYQVVSARLGILAGPYEFSIFADNLTDERPVLGFGGAGGDPALLPGGTAPGAGFALTTIRPRFIGLSAAMSF
jgi:outer membrane receptor protein involved in Fe transport